MGPVDTQGWLWATQRFYLSVVHHPVLTIPICAFFFFLFVIVLNISQLKLNCEL